MTYITHARTAEQLRAEVLSDLNRRLARLNLQYDNSPSAIAKSRLTSAVNELNDMLYFWTELTIAGGKSQPPAPSPSRALLKGT